MARIELELTAIVLYDSEFSCEDYKIVAFVADWSNFEQVNKAAEKAFNDHMANSEKLCIGGYSDIFVNKEKIGAAMFKNPDTDPELLDQAAELFGLEEGTVH